MEHGHTRERNLHLLNIANVFAQYSLYTARTVDQALTAIGTIKFVHYRVLSAC